MSLLLLLLGLLWASGPASSCPEGCRCSRADYVVSCSNQELRRVPADLPKWTRRLDLSGNRIEIVDAEPLSRLGDLRELLLNSNAISALAPGAFAANRRLLLLRLDANRLSSLSARHLRGLAQLRLLRLDANRLSSFPGVALRRLLPRLASLRVDANPLACGCSLLAVRPLLVQAEDERHRAQCASPAYLARRPLMGLRARHLTPPCPPSPPPAPGDSRPQIHAPPRSQEWTPGAAATLRCGARGRPAPSMAWLKDDRLVTGVDGRSEVSQDGARLRLLELHTADAGVYTCVAANPLGRARARADISVVEARAPLIRRKPVDQEVALGDTAQFWCEASGRPRPRIRWIRKHVFSQLLTNSTKYRVLNNSMLVRNVSTADEDSLFICTASSEYGSVQAGAQIRVRAPPLQASKASKASGRAGTPGLAQDDLFNRAIARARLEVSRAVNATLLRLRDRSLRRTAVDVATLFRQPNEEAIQLSRAAEIYERAVEQVELVLRRNRLNLTAGAAGGLATRLLSDDQLSIIARLSGCQRQSQENVDCSHQMCFHNRYRSIDGTCNNLRKPRLGAALSPFYRLLQPQYENGVNEPIGWNLNRLYAGFPKPSPRLVSMRLLSAPVVTRSEEYSSMLMQWGQFLDHDLDFTPVDASNRRFSDGVTCNETCVNESPCFPINVPPEDRRIRRRPCIGFARSSATCGSGATSLLLGQAHFREQINQITSFIDASNVYGSHQLEANELRELDYAEGKLREGMPTAHKTRLLPFNTRAPVDCQLDASQLHVPCFLAGDHRANENLGLLAMHMLWYREHNRLVTRLRLYNPHWSGDRLYYEGRKIVGAMMQHITYTSWLPKILGPDGMRRLGRRYKGYDESVDPSISNAFATAAFRFGHTLINPVLYRLNDTFGEIKAGHLPLHKAFFAPHKIVQDGGIDPILRGLLVSGVKTVTPKQPMNTELTENLFKLAHEVALDLGALNIQRGRDHGIPGYVAWRRACNLSVPTNFDGLRWEMPDPDIRERLRQVYGHPDNIDLFAGGVLEQPLAGGQVGPTFACILVDQFRRLRTGDRFWYESPAYFSPSQLAQLRRTSLARVLCDNSDALRRVMRDPFRLPASIDEFVDCRSVPEIELGPWKDCRSSDDLDNRNTPFNRRSRRAADAAGPNQRMVDALFARVSQLETQVKVLAAKLKVG